MRLIKLALALGILLFTSCAASYTKKEFSDTSKSIRAAVSGAALLKRACDEAEATIAARTVQLRAEVLSPANPVEARVKWNAFRAKVIALEAAIKDARRFERFTVRNKTSKLCSRDLWEWRAEADAWTTLATLAQQRLTLARKALGSR